MKRKGAKVRPSSEEAVLARLKLEVSEDRYRHVQGVVKTAEWLARRHRVNRRHARLAAALHDCGKFEEMAAQRSAVKRYRVALDPWERRHPPVWHAPLGARLARLRYGIREAAVLRAIRRHTVAEPGMSPLDMVVFVADAIEEGRRYAGVGKIRRLAPRSLTGAFQEALRSKITHLVTLGREIHPRAWAAWNWACQKGFGGR